MVNLSIGTFNVKKLANDKKRKEIFYWLKGKKMNIYFLKDTHCNNETELKFQSDWGEKCIFSNLTLKCFCIYIFICYVLKCIGM
jgi:hypothetical protein